MPTLPHVLQFHAWLLQTQRYIILNSRFSFSFLHCASNRQEDRTIGLLFNIFFLSSSSFAICMLLAIEFLLLRSWALQLNSNSSAPVSASTTGQDAIALQSDAISVFSAGLVDIRNRIHDDDIDHFDDASNAHVVSRTSICFADHSTTAAVDEASTLDSRRRLTSHAAPAPLRASSMRALPEWIKLAHIVLGASLLVSSVSLRIVMWATANGVWNAVVLFQEAATVLFGTVFLLVYASRICRHVARVEADLLARLQAAKASVAGAVATARAQVAVTAASASLSAPLSPSVGSPAVCLMPLPIPAPLVASTGSRISCSSVAPESPVNAVAAVSFRSAYVDDWRQYTRLGGCFGRDHLSGFRRWILYLVTILCTTIGYLFYRAAQVFADADVPYSDANATPFVSIFAPTLIFAGNAVALYMMWLPMGASGGSDSTDAMEPAMRRRQQAETSSSWWQSSPSSSSEATPLERMFQSVDEDAPYMDFLEAEAMRESFSLSVSSTASSHRPSTDASPSKARV